MALLQVKDPITGQIVELTGSSTSLSDIATNAGGMSGLDKNSGAAGATTLRVVEALKSFQRYRSTALSSTKVQVKGSAGNVYGWNFINTNTSDVFVKFYDGLAANVTVGTTTPVLTILVPAASGSSNGLFFQDINPDPQEVFTAGITIACVTGLADSSTTAPTTAIHASVRYV